VSAALLPQTAEELAALLATHAQAGRSISLAGNGSKRLMAGPALPSDISISTASLRRVLVYEPNDLTISVEAGLPWCELQDLLAAHGQMVALDPPFAKEATVGGVVAANASGPLRRGFGSARDLVIGMQFATLQGKLASSGGMVVKNVAGLDVSKLMIGSFGTLAAIASVNFRLHPLPESTRTVLYSCADLEATLGQRDTLLQSPWKFISLDLLTPVAGTRLGLRDWILAARIAGPPSLMARGEREFSGSSVLHGDGEAALWQRIRDFTPEFLRRQKSGVVLRVSTSLSDVRDLLKLVSGTAISRAGNGVSYLYLSAWQSVAPIWQAAADKGWAAAVEFAPDDVRRSNELWLLPPSQARQNSFDMMKQVKHMFDPGKHLNRLRLYGRI
jgi:glycolate oxidase FAD binding subunit